MSYEFKKINETAIIDNLSDSAKLLLEENGEMKRINADQVGGRQRRIEFIFDDSKETNNSALLNLQQTLDIYQKNGVIYYIVQNYNYQEDSQNSCYDSSNNNKYTFTMRTFPYINDLFTLKDAMPDYDKYVMFNESGDCLIYTESQIQDSSFEITTSKDYSIVGVYTNV